VVNSGGKDFTAPFAAVVSPPQLARQTVTVQLEKGPDDFGLIPIFVAASDVQNGVFVYALGGSGSMSVHGCYSVQGGKFSDLNVPWTGVPWDASGRGTINFSVSADGNTLTVTLNGSSQSSFTIDLTNRTKGPLAGLCGGYNYVNWLVPSGHRVLGFSWVVQKTKLSCGDVPLFANGVSAVWPLSWDTSLTKPTGVQHSFDGQNWITGDSVVGDNGTISYTGTAPHGGLLQPTFRALNDIASTAAAPDPTGFLYAGSFAMGFNLGSPGTYSCGVTLADWGKISSINNQFGKVYIPPQSITTLSGQVDTVTTDVGVTLTPYDDSLEVVSSDPSTGLHQVRVLHDAALYENGGTGNLNVRAFSFSGPLTRFNVQRGGVTGKVAPEALAGIPPGTVCFRDLDMSGANFVLGNTRSKVTDSNYLMESTGSVLPPEDIIDFFAAAMAVCPTLKRLWHVFPVDATDDEVRTFFQYFRDNAPQGAELYFTYGNETWNWTFAPVLNYLQVTALKAGYYGAATAGSPQPVPNIVAYAGLNDTAPAASKGDWACINDSVYEAQKQLSAGTSYTDTASWQVRPDVSQHVSSQMWQAVRHNQIIDIGMSVFGARSAQLVPTIDGQVSADGLYNQLSYRLGYVPGYAARIRAGGFTFYTDVDDSYDGSDPSPAGIDASYRKNLHTTTVPLRAMVRDCVRLGWRVACYEGGTTNSRMSRQQGEGWYNSSYHATFLQDFARWMKANVPGTCNWFTLGGYYPFALEYGFQDTSNPRLVNWLAGLAY
jgi:hypothetical protein